VLLFHTFQGVEIRPREEKGAIVNKP